MFKLKPNWILLICINAMIYCPAIALLWKMNKSSIGLDGTAINHSLTAVLLLNLVFIIFLIYFIYIQYCQLTVQFNQNGIRVRKFFRDTTYQWEDLDFVFVNSAVLTLEHGGKKIYINLSYFSNTNDLLKLVDEKQKGNSKGSKNNEGHL